MKETHRISPTFVPKRRERRRRLCKRNGRLLLLSPVLAGLLGWSSVAAQEPSGPIARFGSRPTIDGVFEAAEWDDAEVIRTGENQHVRIKHDATNLFIAIDAGGGNLWFDFEEGLRVLHWSAQLGSAEYVRSDSSTQILDRQSDYELFGLQSEAAEVIQKALSEYLAKNGWVSNISPMGPKMQSEFAVSLEWLGVTGGSVRYREIPRIHVAGGLMLVREDPEVEAIMAMPVEERRKKYPSLFWPGASEPGHPLNQGSWPDTIRFDPEDFARIWIDFSPP